MSSTRFDQPAGGKEEQSVDELRATLELYRSLVRASPDAMTSTDLEGKITAVSKRTLELHGFASEEEAIGFPAAKLIAAEDHPRVAENTARTIEQGLVGPVVYTMLRTDGSRFRGELYAAVVTDEDGAPRAFVATVRDVTAREAAERALRESEKRARMVIELSPDPVVILQGDGYVSVNREFTRVFGYTREEVDAGLSFYALVPEHERAAVRERYDARLAGESLSHVHRIDLLAKDGRVVPCETTATRIEHAGAPADLVIMRDVGERLAAEARHRQMEEKLQQVQKLESLGVLAGGIAHDFNNLLVGILGNASLARRGLPGDSEALARVELIETAARRAADLCNQLLAYAGRGRLEVEDVDVGELVSEMTGLLELPLATKAELRRELAPGLPTVAADATRLRQVVMNLITNAGDALDGRGGVITLRTGARRLTAAEQRAHDVPAPPGGDGAFVSLQVTDDGCGMDATTRAHIFDPFFSTKPTGRGLGLAAVHGFVRAHGGAIDVTSELGRGTTFELLLPASAPTTSVPSRSAPAPRAAQVPVMVVDDDEMVRAVMRNLLVDEGFEVVTAADGHDALELLDGAARVGLVILDLTMPRMSGEELYRAIRSRDARLALLLTSGYHATDVERLIADDPCAEFLHKPFDLDDLVDLVHRVLGAAREPA